MNKILAEGGSDKKWTAEDYVQDQFDKAMKETMLRAEDKVVKWSTLFNANNDLLMWEKEV